MLLLVMQKVNRATLNTSVSCILFCHGRIQAGHLEPYFSTRHSDTDLLTTLEDVLCEGFVPEPCSQGKKSSKEYEQRKAEERKYLEDTGDRETSPSPMKSQKIKHAEQNEHRANSH